MLTGNLSGMVMRLSLFRTLDSSQTLPPPTAVVPKLGGRPPWWGAEALQGGRGRPGEELKSGKMFNEYDLCRGNKQTGVC